MAAVITRVQSQSTDKSYEIRVGKDGRVYCTCPAWKFSRGTREEKNCKHLRGLQETEVVISIKAIPAR